MVKSVTIRYFGVISELTGKAEEEFIFQEGTSVKELLGTCHQKYPELKDTSFQIALNKKIVGDGAVSHLDELALLPPFSGG